MTPDQERGPAPQDGVEALVEAGDWTGLDADALCARAFEAVKAAAPQTAGQASVLFTDDAAMQRLNREFRNKDAPTNVLSFPAGAAATPEWRWLGDIALADGVCRREAAARGVPLADHVLHLLVHGMLHLIGYDHQSDEDAALMESQETAILAAIGVADPYAGPAETQNE